MLAGGRRGRTLVFFTGRTLVFFRGRTLRCSELLIFSTSQHPQFISKFPFILDGGRRERRLR